jgi:GC-rich sequence DNA-binding factor
LSLNFATPSLRHSSTTTITMSSSNRARNFRRRAGDDDEDNQNDDSNATTTTTTTTARPTKPKPKKLLSFADDEDAAETPSSRSTTASRSKRTSNSSSRPTKPSSSGHKITTHRDRQSHSSTTSSTLSNVQPQAGTYTKEALLELQKNTRTLGPSRPASSEPVIVLKGLIKPSSDPPIDEAEELDEYNAEDEDRRDAQARMASLGIGKAQDSALIPDQATINAIRAKRERLRQSRAAAPDFISLDGGSNHGEAEGLSDEEPEFRGRIALFGEKKSGGLTTTTNTTKKGVFEDVDERAIDVNFGKKDSGENDNDEEDDEEKIWEEEQFRKGLGKRMDDGTSRVAVTARTVVPVVQSVQQQQQKFVYPAMPSVSGGPSIGGAIGVSQGLDAMISIPQQAEIAKKALQDNVRRLKVWNAYLIAKLNLRVVYIFI